MFCRFPGLPLLYKKTTEKAMKSKYGISTFFEKSADSVDLRLHVSF